MSSDLVEQRGSVPDAGPKAAAPGELDATDRPVTEGTASLGTRLLDLFVAVHPAAWLTWTGALIFAIVFGRLGVQHHRNFGTWAFDMGIYDQGFWLVSRGKSFVTVRGIDFWGHHVNLIAYAFAPFYWFGAGPSFLYVAQATALGAGAIPTYLIARDRTRNEWVGLAFAVTYLLYAPIQWIAWANFHPEALVVTPLLLAWWYGSQRRWVGCYAWLVVALSTREDAALAVTIFGVALWWTIGRLDDRAARTATQTADTTASTTADDLDSVADDSDVDPEHDPADVRHTSDSGRGLALAASVLGLVWYVITSRLVIPAFNQWQQPFYIGYFYGNYGANTTEIVQTIVTRPDRVISDATQPDRLRFYRDLLLPWGGLPLAGLGQLAMAGPQMLASVIGQSPYARTIRYQYTAVMIAPIVIASIEGAAWMWRHRFVRRFLVPWLLVCAYVSNVAWSPSPMSPNDTVWAQPLARHEILRRAVSLVPDDASVTATYSLGPHLSHREQIYDWPNPFRPAYWGNDDTYRLPDPSEIDYLVLDRTHISTDDRPMLDALIAPGGEYQVLLDLDDVLVARRLGD